MATKKNFEVQRRRTITVGATDMKKYFRNKSRETRSKLLNEFPKSFNELKLGVEKYHELWSRYREIKAGLIPRTVRNFLDARVGKDVYEDTANPIKRDQEYFAQELQRLTDEADKLEERIQIALNLLKDFVHKFSLHVDIHPEEQNFASVLQAFEEKRIVQLFHISQELKGAKSKEKS